MAAILYVRLKSALGDVELERRVNERKSQFLEVPGLLQKIYGRDEKSGAVCGIYFFESEVALAEYLETDLAATIPTAYEVENVRIEEYHVMSSLKPDRGPM